LTSMEVMGSSLATVQLFTERTCSDIENAQISSDEKLKHLRILVVEDDPDTQELLKTVLQQHGAEVVSAGSAESALAEFERAKPDVIISDIAMAGENGYELIRRIRSLGPAAGGHVPAIALTAYASVADRRRALLAGFQTHLAKPIEPADLLAVILSLTFQPDPETDHKRKPQEQKLKNDR